MPSNMEIKAKVNDPAPLMDVAAAIADENQVIRQKDTFFPTKRGRLKLRELSADKGELIYYERPDAPGPKESRYHISETRDPRGLCITLAAALGTAGVVRKVRHVFIAGQTRIHIDEVDGLGHFVELEVVLQHGQKPADSVKVAEDFMKRLGIRKENLIEKAYVDLLREQEGNRANAADAPQAKASGLD